MKNRKSSSQHDNISVKRLETEIVKSYSDLKSRKKSATNNFLQQSVQFLQTYNQYLQKTPNSGDADRFFRQSLRNYEQFDLRSLKVDKRSCSAKSSESFKRERKARSAFLTNTGTDKLLKPGSGKKEHAKQRPVVVENIFAPVEQKNKKASKMTEEDITPGELDMDTEEDVTADPFGGVEELVEQVDNELNQVMEDNLLDAEGEGEVVDLIEEYGDEEEGEGDIGPATGTEDDESVFQKLEAAAEQVDGGPQSAAGEEPTDTSVTPLPEDSSAAAGAGKEKPQEEKPSASQPAAGDQSTEDSVLREVEECEKQCMDIYVILNELKARVTELLMKPSRTAQEDQELAEKQKTLNEKMQLLEQKTIRIETLLNKAKQTKKDEQFNRKHSEDALPKVIICGLTEGNMPKLIVCDDNKKKRKKSAKKERGSAVVPPPDMAVMPQFAKRLSESYNMQEKLAAENADLEGMRYKLQEDLICKDQTVESLQRKLCSLQAEMRMVVKENSLLNEKLQTCIAPCSKGDIGLDRAVKKDRKRMPCGKGRGPCPGEMEQRLQEYSDTTQQLEKQLGDMESEVRNMQNELVAVQKERLHLEQHRRMLCNPPCTPVCPAPCGTPPCTAPCSRPSPEQQLRELREKYNSLQDDYKGKLTEVASLRADAEGLKKSAKDAEDAKKKLQDKFLEVEKELLTLREETNKMRGNKETMVELEQQLNVAKTRYREAKDELEEVRALVEDQQGQLDDYRNKYLQAQQQVEEQRRQMDMMELENNRISEQVNLEIQRVKNQFQEKLQELTPLPDILKATQIKLQEAQQMHLLAERNNEGLVRELQAYRDKAAQMADQMEKVRSDNQLGADEKAQLVARVEEWEKKCNELMDENEKLRNEITRLENAADECEKRCQEKAHEIAQLVAEVDNVREESARQVARTKDRCETVRRSMQNQIADLERQLAQSRASARAAQKDRDEIRQKMQSQINNLNENFEDAQMRIRNLQGHVNFLKNSYTNVFPGNELIGDSGVDPCNCAATNF